MNIIKSTGIKQAFSPNKVWKRIKDQCKDLNGTKPDKLFQMVIPAIQDDMSTTTIDEILAYKAADMIIEHPDYAIVGGRILMTRQSKLIGIPCEPVDLTYDMFGALTFLKKYSARNEAGEPIELPHMMYKRVADYLGDTSEEKAMFYSFLSAKRISVATPILTNAGTNRNGLVSCNLTVLNEDSTDGILRTLGSISQASREGAGIGLCIDSLRSKESLVSTFRDKAGGVTRFADMVQSHMRFFRQGSRSGSCALYLSVWHKDIMDFLDLRLPVGDEKLRTRDLFTAVIINDAFMKALQNGENWYLFCPKDLADAELRPFEDLWGEEFEAEYAKAIELGLGKPINPKRIWDALISSMVKSGTPYVFYKDNANRKNMQDNLGVVRQSNLCIEITEVSRPGYTAQCTLGLVNLAENDSISDIVESATVLTQILNKVIDKTDWPDLAAMMAGKEQRAIAIGVAGLADFFAKKDIAFYSEDAIIWNKDIFKALYTGAFTMSKTLARLSEVSYPAWSGSPYSRGINLIEKFDEPIPMANSLLIGLMPSASTSILLGVNECFEPFNSNIFTRHTGVGEFVIVNKYLVKDLEAINLWTEDIQRQLIENSGSVQNLDIPENLKEKYRTIWEIPMRHIIDMAADRQQYIDQSQSMNLYFANPEYSKISAALIHGWSRGLKTGCYYLKTQKQTNKPTRLFSNTEKPKDSPFECVGCSA